MVHPTSRTDLMRWSDRRTAIGVLIYGASPAAPITPLEVGSIRFPFETIDPIDSPLPLKPDFFALPNARRLTA